MTSLRTVAAMIRRHGGVVVWPEFLGADGAADMRLGPLVVTDLLVNSAGLVFQHVDGGRVHWQSGRHVVRDGDALVVLGDLRHSRLVIEPPRSEEHRRRVDASRQPKRRPAAPMLREILDDLQANRRPAGRRAPPSRECWASWHARLNGAGLLDSCGAAVLRGRRLVYASLDGGAVRDLRADFAEAHARRPAADLFGCLIECGNGQTNEWSRPFVLAAPSIEVAAARVVTRLRFRDDLAGHLRELWLAAVPDGMQDAVTEAEAIIEGRSLDARASEYLARLRAAARARTGRHPAGSRSTRRSRARSRSRGGGENAS
jgi:hypothetical protein